MAATVAIVGLLIMFALATIVGLVESGSQRSAWNRIAAARKEISEDRRAIDELTVALQVREDRLKLREDRRKLRERIPCLREVPSRDTTSAAGEETVLWGVGVNGSIVSASLKAVVSAVNRAMR